MKTPGWRQGPDMSPLRIMTGKGGWVPENMWVRISGFAHIWSGEMLILQSMR